MKPVRGGPRGWGLALVAGAHALLLGWAWAQSQSQSQMADAPGLPPPAVLVAQLLSPAGHEPAPEAAPPLPRPREALPLPAAPGLAAPELPDTSPTATPPVAAPPTAPAVAVATAPGAEAAVPSPSTSADARPALATAALASPRPAAAPAAPRRSPAYHAGCADVPHPLALRERGIEGLVQLRVQVGSDGRARQVQLLGSSGWRLFDEAALAKARSCRFRPALDGDTAIESWVEFPVRFALTQS